LTAVAWGTYDSLRATQAETEFFRLVPGARRAGISQIALFQIARGNYESAEERLLSQARGDDQLRGDARWYVMIALRNQGRLREALRVGRGNLPRNDPWWGLDPKPDTLNSALIEYEQGKPASCIGMMEAVPRQPNHRQLAADWPGQAAREESWALARLVMCRASQGDTTGFSAMADTLQKLGSISNFGRDRRLHHYVRGLLWKARGKPEQAVAELQAAISSPTFGFTRINYELGQLLLQLGRPGDAVAILQPALRGALDASNLYLSRTEIHELLAKAWDSAGRADSARAHWAQVERSWRGADPQFHARWEVAKNKVRQSVTR
jgi:tetratricopeptide (TPR) repeat protein